MLRRLLSLLGLPDSLRLRLIIFSVAIALPFVGLLWWGIVSRHETDRAAAAAQLRSQREIAQKAIAAYFARLRATMADLERNGDFTRPDDPATRELCEQFLRFHPEALNVAVVDRAGLLRFSVTFPISDPPQDYSKMENIRSMLQTDGWGVSESAVGLQTGRWGIAIVQPLRGRPDLLLSVPIDLVQLSRHVLLAADEPGLIVSAGDLNNRAVLSSHRPESRIGSLRPAAKVVRDRLRTGHSTGEFVGNDGVPRTYDAAQIAGTNWVLSAAVPTASIHQGAIDSLKLSIILVICAVVVGAIIVHFSTRSLARPSIALARTARALATDPGAPLAVVDGPREVAETARAFNEMVRARRAADATLQENDQRFRVVLEQTGQMIYDLDLRTGVPRWLGNAAIVAITGCTPEEFNRTGIAEWAELVHPEDRAAAVGALETSRRDRSLYAQEYRMRHKDGTYRIVEDYGAYIFDETGEAIRLVGRISDITAKRSTEVALRASEERYRIVAEETRQLIYEFDIPSGSVSWFGETAARQILGVSPADLAREGVEGWSSRLHPEDRETSVARFQRSITHGLPCRTEYRLRHADGGYHIVEESGVVLRDPQGAPSRMIGRMTDITERRAAEAAQQQLQQKMLETQKLESLGVLAGGIAHDFNNLLTGILGHANLARFGAPENWAGTEHLKQVEKSALRAADLCRQMLAYSGRGQFIVQPVDLNEVVTDTAQLVAVSVSKKATLKVSTASAPLTVRADPTQIHQVIMNLVINASEALEDRTGVITLEAAALDLSTADLARLQLRDYLQAGPHCCLTVCDTGCGMSPETLSRIFEPFFTTKFTGRGLGLAAVLGIVRGHKGAIKVESEPGRGTSFRIYLPAIAEAAQPMQDTVEPVRNWTGRGRILVVDDEEPVRDVAALALEQAGFEADQARDGVEAVDLFTRHPGAYAAVLLDLTMPRLDGRDTFRQLRALDPGACIVLMSGFNRHEAINRFSGEGLSGFLQKPFTLDALLGEIRRATEASTDTPPTA